MENKMPEHYEVAKILADNFTPEEYDDSDFEWCAYQLVQAGYRKTSKGKWIKPTPCSQEYCDNCGLTPKLVFGMLPNFCPNCGADMRSKEIIKKYEQT